MARAELVVKGGLVVDGSGDAAVTADVAVAHGRVVDVGPDLDGVTVLDATGAVVAPGFIDLHTHYDPQVTWDPWLTPSSYLGVTSVVAGNCGFSLAPCRPDLRHTMMRTLEAVEDMSYAAMDEAIPWTFATYPEYLEGVGARRPGLNFGGYVGHTAVRLWVMGEDAYERQATPAEVDDMALVVRQAVEGGALGFSTDRAGFLQGAGGRPVPSVVASWAETERLCLAVAEAGRGIVHVAPGNSMANVEWIYDFAPRFGRTITWSAILAFPDGSGQVDWRDKLGCHLDHRQGLDVHPQVTSRKLTFEWGLENPLTLYRYPSFGDLGRTDGPRRLELFADPQWRDQARLRDGVVPDRLVPHGGHRRRTRPAPPARTWPASPPAVGSTPSTPCSTWPWPTDCRPGSRSRRRTSTPPPSPPSSPPKTACSASPTPGLTSASCVTPSCPCTSSPSGCATVR